MRRTTSTQAWPWSPDHVIWLAVAACGIALTISLRQALDMGPPHIYQAQIIPNSHQQGLVAVRFVDHGLSHTVRVPDIGLAAGPVALSIRWSQRHPFIMRHARIQAIPHPPPTDAMPPVEPMSGAP